MSSQSDLSEFVFPADEDCGHLERYRVGGECLRCGNEHLPDGPADGIHEAREGRSAGGGPQ